MLSEHIDKVDKCGWFGPSKRWPCATAQLLLSLFSSQLNLPIWATNNSSVCVPQYPWQEVCRMFCAGPHPPPFFFGGTLKAHFTNRNLCWVLMAFDQALALQHCWPLWQNWPQQHSIILTHCACATKIHNIWRRF